MTARPARSLGPALAVLSGVLLAAELCLTRLLSVVLWYHFAFFAISIALFGLSLAALTVHFTAARIPERDTERWLAFGALATAGGILIVDVAFCNVTPDWFGGQLGAFTSLTGKLGLLFLIGALPFFAGGFVISLALTRYAPFAGRLYAWDLLGAALGAVGTIGLLSWLGAPGALALLGAGAALSGLAFAPRITLVRVSGLGTAAAIGVVVASGGGPFTLHVAKGIEVERASAEVMKWNAFSLVTVLPYTGFRGWGISPRYGGEIPEQKTLVIDMNAMTPLVRFDGDLARVEFVTHDLSAFVYRVAPASGRSLVIGAGGGKDVLAALTSGSRHVTAVEVNPLIAHGVMRGSHREFVGDLYGRSDVTLVIEDGRSFVRRTSERYDIVQLSMVDTSAASAAGAYALTENALYTVEAFDDFMSVLEPKGLLSVSSVSLPDLWVGARLAAIAREALGRRGLSAKERLVVIETPWLGAPHARMYTLLVAPGGFEPERVQRAISETAALGFSLAFVPGAEVVAGTAEREWIARIAKGEDEAALAAQLRGLALDVSATTDDRPFFFYQNRLRDLPVALTSSMPVHLFGNGLVLLAKIALVAVAAVLVLLVVPWWFGRRSLPSGQGSVARDLGYAGGIGLGFMLVELGMLHRLSPHLGDPTFALGVILVALLVGSAFGSRWLSTRGARVTRGVLAMVVLASLITVLLLPPMTELSRAWSPPLRASLFAAWVFVLGLVMGVPLPAALSAIGRRAPGRVAWFWAINGGTSVLGSVLATLIALEFGATAALLAGASAYAGVVLLAPRVLRVDAQ
ncbi:MAG: hypothetical protein KF718_13555 [Polyangiaceae bacterium]|nr:hypothetical protein [Polyangiaceae bacterium]